MSSTRRWYRLLVRGVLLVGFPAAVLLTVGHAIWAATQPAAASADPSAAAIAQNLSSFSSTLDQVQSVDALSAALPLQAKAQVSALLQKANGFADAAATELNNLANDSSLTPTTLDQKLDDLDGNGDSTSDVPGLTGVTVDINGTVAPHTTGAAQYTIGLTWSVQTSATGPISLAADGIPVTGQPLSGSLAITGQASFAFKPGAAAPNKFVVTNVTAPLAQTHLSLGADFGNTDPAHGGDAPALSVNVGILGASATGTADADITIGVKLHDANGDGRIDTNELADPATLFGESCTGGQVHAHLSVTADVSGLAGKVGTISLDDTNVCDGLPVPTVTLGDLNEFRSIGPADVINGLAELTTALKSLQANSDLDIPFIKQGLSSFVSFNDKLVKFFVDNGFTDPAKPMDNITVDPTQLATVDTLQKLLPKLATALGLPSADSLGLAWAHDAVTIQLHLSADPGPLADAGTLDFGDQLKGVGLIGLTGTAKATIDPSYTIDLGLGIDLRPGLDLTQRFFFDAGDGPEITADAAVSADLNLTGKVALLDVTAGDANPSGPVPLLQRKDPSKPMLSVQLDGRGDDRLTLDEIATAVSAAQLPFAITTNATVPSTPLTIASSIAGTPLAAGTVTISWPDISAPSGLSVTADGQFQQSVLPFSYDPNNPVGSISTFMKAAQAALQSLHDLVGGNGTTTGSLPLVGKSLADFDPILTQLQGKLDDIVQATDALTLADARDELAHVIAQALGLPASAEPGLLALEYKPATSSSQAALVAHLKLGICTTDRAGSGCSKTVAQPTYPLNLQLGSTINAVGLAGITSSGTLAASFDAVLSLDFGIQLPTVTPSAPGSTPTSNGVPQPFVLDTSNFTVGIGVAGSGTLQATLGPATIELRAATAMLAARFRLGLASPTGARLAIGSSDLNTWLNNIVPTTVHDTTHPSGCPSSADACASLPVYLDNNSLGTITFTAPNLLDPSTWSLTGVDDVLDAVQSSDIVFDVLADGLKTLVGKLSDALTAIPSGTTIPLLGDNLTAGANVVSQITTGIVTPAINLAQSLHSAATAGNARSTIQNFFVQHVGPSGDVPLLQDANNDGTVNASDVTVILKCDHSGTIEDCADSDSLIKLDSMEVHAKLGSSIAGATPAFDIGFPGFRLASTGHLTGQVGFTYNLAFGIDKERGFYIPTAGSQPELQVVASAGLPNAAGSDNDLTGDIAFIPITAEDQHAGDDVKVSAGIDLTGGDDQGHLGLQELNTVSATPSISVCANVSMTVKTAMGNTTNGSLPNLAGTLNIKGGYTCDGSLGAPNGSGFTMGIDDVSVDVGTFVNKFIGPIVHDIHKVTGPLEPVVNAIESPIPGVEDAAKLAGLTPPTWYGLFKTFANASGNGDGLQLVDRVIDLIKVVKELDAKPGGSGSINIGSFDLNPGAASQPLATDHLDALIGSTDVPDARSIIERLGDSGIHVPALDAIEEAENAGGFSFPAFEHPATLFGLLIGKDVTLVHYDAGTLSVSASFEASFNVGPVVLSIGGGAGIDGHFAVGYDTAGLRYAYKVLTDDDPSNNGAFDLAAGLIQGFYIDDLDSAGKDVPEIKFTGQLSVGAGVGIPGFNVSVDGGVTGEVDFDLNDPDGDGKVHFQEFVDELKINANPLCLFKVGAKIGAFIQIKFEALFFSYTIPIADTVLYEQPDITSFCQHPNPGLGTKYSDGTLALTTTNQPDTFLVDVTAPGTILVSARGTSQQFKGITRIFADGGGGSDQVQVISHTTAPMPAFLCGGAGSDQLAATAGPATLYGDDGPGITAGGTTLPCTSAGGGGGDTLTSGDSGDTLDGGPGNDVMVSAGGDDVLHGDDGNDTMRAGLGNDTIDGGTGDDTSDYADHPGGVSATAMTGGGQIGTSEHDTAPGVESIIGSPYDDTLLGPASGVTHMDGLAGNDTLLGSSGPDLMLGSQGNDILKPAGGINQVIGGPGDDTFVNGVNGTDTYDGGDGFDTADYSAAATPVTLSVDGVANDGPSGDPLDNVTTAEHLVGGSANDVISAATANSVLDGNAGNDNLMGGGGDDVLNGGNNDDRLEGGAGADAFNGGAGNDTADFSNRTDGLTISVDDQANDGAALDRNGDNAHTDIEHVVGGSGDDLINARVNADDLTEGGPGNDTIVGNGGTDRLDGGPGDDDLIGGAGVDVITGDDGNDQLSGQAGNDRLDVGIGNNAAFGGTGNDTLIGGPNSDLLRGGANDDTITGGDGNDTLYGDAPTSGPTDGTDSIMGGSGNDRIYGGGGTDSIDGGDGNDTITGEAGNDTITGAANDDHVYGAIGDDHVNGGDGNDLVSGDDGNDLVDGGNGNDTLKGAAGNDTLTGDAGDDVLDGGTYNDVLDGGANADQLIGGAGTDTATWAGRSESLDLSVDGSADDGGASDVPSAGGSDPGDSLDNSVEKLVGGSGNDSLSVAADLSYTLDGGPGNDTLSVASFVVHPQMLLGSAGNDTLTGGSGSDALDGGADNDVEQGGSGDDRFLQGASVNGADSMFGGNGFDTVNYAQRTGTVSVTLDNVANDGSPGENDNVHKDIEGKQTPA